MGTEIFKQDADGKMLFQEAELLKDKCPRYCFYVDRANGYIAFYLNNVSREDASNLVDELNAICDEHKQVTNWFVGDEDEEYVFVN